MTVNSESDSGVKYASKGALLLSILVNLKVTLVVLFIGDLIEIISSGLGGSASKLTLNLID